MVNIQEWYNKEKKKIKSDLGNFQGQLVIDKEYSEVKEIDLYSIKSIDGLTLSNLPHLQNCAIRKCNLKKLVVENCPLLKVLNIKNNSLTNLEFLAGLENLEELEIEGNIELIKILKPYKSDWKVYKEDKDVKEIFELIRQDNFHELAKKCLDLKKSREDLKKDVSYLQKKFSHGTTSKLIDLINTHELLTGLEKQFQEKEMEVNNLNSRVEELINLNKEQENKVISAYYYCVSGKEEKDLLDKLIRIHIEFTKFKEQEFGSPDLRKRRKEYQSCRQEIENEIEVKIETRLQYKFEQKVIEDLKEETMNKIEQILIECEKMTNQQLELEDKLSEGIFLVKIQEEILLQMSIDNKEIEKLKIKLAEAEGQIKVYKEQALKPTLQQFFINNQYNQYNTQYLINELEQEVNKSLVNEKEITPQEQRVINQTILFLGTKELFINYRQEIINRLIDCYCKLAGKNKSNKFTSFNSMMGITSKLVGTIPGGGVAETPLGIVGDIANLTGIIVQEKNLKKCVKEFQKILVEDEKNLSLFDENYRSLIQVIWPDNEKRELIKTIIDILQLDQTKLRPFNNDYNVFKAGGVWKQNFPNLDSTELRNFVESLAKSLDNFQQEFQQQRKQLSQQTWFKKIKEQTDLLKQQVQTQIEVPPK